MNSTFGFWALGAGVVAMVLLLLLGGPATDGTDPAPDVVAVANASTAAADADTTSTYWQPVTAANTAASASAAAVSVSPPTRMTPGSAVAAMPSGATVMTTAAPAISGRSVSACPSCGAAPSIATVPIVTPVTPNLVGGCGSPSVPCGLPRCTTCARAVPTVVPVTIPEPPAGVVLVGGCGMPSTPCGGTTCYPATCSPGCCYDVCTDPCHVLRPGINRNMALCVDECSFIQLHSTVAHPICEQVCFQWSASKGWFLDPTVSDPLFFAPSTQFCNGEEVWITLLVTDAAGAQYSDVVTLYVRDLP